jgi:hypothetical protein
MIVSDFKNTRAFLRNFKEDTRGSMTVFGLFFFLFSGILGAIALDVTFLYAERTHLQVAADQAAHAALYNHKVVGLDEQNSKQAALDIVAATLPFAKYGTVLEADNIEFGDYDAVTRVFTPGAGFSAARASTAFTDGRGNSASALLFRLIGRKSFEIYTRAIFDTTLPGCVTDGFLAVGKINMNNQNTFGVDFCIHSNDLIEISPNNVFTGSIVQVPGGLGSLDISLLNNLSFEERTAYLTELESDPDNQKLVGLLDAVRNVETFDPKVLHRVDNMVAFYMGEDPKWGDITGDTPDWPDYITSSDGTVPTIKQVDDRDFEINPETVTAGGAYYIPRCGKNDSKTGTLTINSSSEEPLRELVIITDCDIQFGAGTVIQRARIISTSSDPRQAMKSANGFTLGKSVMVDGNIKCQTTDVDNGVQMYTNGGFDFAANFNAYGSQVLSGGNMQFAAAPSANGYDFVGTTLITEGEINMASHVNALVGCVDGGDPGDIVAFDMTLVL